MPDFDDSFLSYCERTERKRKHSYNFNSARNSSVGGSSFSIEKGGHQQNGGSRSNLLATAKSYSKTLPRSFRKNLQKISQFIRDSDGDLHFYDLNHNEVPAAEVVGATSASCKTERVKSRSRKSDKVISIVDFDRFGSLPPPLPPQVELLANRSLDEEKCLDQSVLVDDDDEKFVEEVASACDNGEGGVEEEEGKYEDGKEAAEAAGGGEENNSK